MRQHQCWTVAGLGMGYTLRATLDALPSDAEVVVCEIDQQIVDWCRGPLAAATQNALADPRVKLELAVNHRYHYFDAHVARTPLFNPERRTA